MFLDIFSKDFCKIQNALDLKIKKYEMKNNLKSVDGLDANRRI
jgi:hypothetical protein